VIIILLGSDKGEVLAIPIRVVGGVKKIKIHLKFYNYP
jgi:hypothetical protein